MTKIEQFNVGGKYTNFQLQDLANDGGYTLTFPLSKEIGVSVATLREGEKLIASFHLITLPEKGSNVFMYQRIF